MKSCRIHIVATLASVTISTPVFARDVQRHSYQDHGVSRHTLLSVGQTKIDAPSWCLRNYSEDFLDCSFSDRAQCGVTASGGLGQCMPNDARGADVSIAGRRIFSFSVDAPANDRASRIDGYARTPQMLSRHHRHFAATDGDRPRTWLSVTRVRYGASQPLGRE